MTSLRDQFSAVRKAQFEAQFDFFNSMTSHALESASRVAALNLSVSRDAVERSLGAGFALMNSRDPRDVLALGGQAEAQMRSLFAYGRELLGIASGMRPYGVRPQALALASRQAIETVEVIEHGVAQASAPVEQAAAASVETLAAAVPDVESIAASATDVAAEAVAETGADAAPAAGASHAVAAFAPVTEPVVVAEPAAAPEPLAAAAEPVPVAEPKAIAKAVGKGSARAAAVPHPAAAPLPEEGEAMAKVELPQASSRRKK